MSKSKSTIKAVRVVSVALAFTFQGIAFRYAIEQFCNTNFLTFIQELQVPEKLIKYRLYSIAYTVLSIFYT